LSPYCDDTQASGERPEGASDAAARFLSRETARAGGQSGEFFWVFPPP